MPGRWLIPLFIVLTVTLPAPAQDRYEDKAERLEAVREQIDRIKDDLDADRRRQGELSQTLRELDRRIGRVTARLRQLSEKIEEKRERVASLRDERQRHAERLEQHKALLARQLTAAQAAGRQEYLRLLLNQEDPARVDRVLAYYDYLSEARAERIADAVAQLRRLQVVERNLNEELERLAELKRQRDGEREQLQADRAKRESVLSRIEQAIARKDQRLEELREDESQLKGLVEDLQKALADIPDDELQRQPFSERKGELRWPLAGDVRHGYGDERGVGELHWRGLMIEAKEGDPVRAVSHGRVVFADWLRGVGLLLIIDHGNGYMTLYGHNQSLYRETGEWVEAGEIIATVGASGGRRRPGLYFEIRRNGQPTNPMAWLSAAPNGRG